MSGEADDTTVQAAATVEVAAPSRGFELVIDRMSAPYLGGATIDFADTLQQQGFVIDNPNAAGSCACGDSFH